MTHFPGKVGTRWNICLGQSISGRERGDRQKAGGRAEAQTLAQMAASKSKAEVGVGAVTVAFDLKRKAALVQQWPDML